VVSSYVEYELTQNKEDEPQAPVPGNSEGTIEDLQNSMEALSQQIEASLPDENTAQRT
jgi:hypothetical protein